MGFYKWKNMKEVIFWTITFRSYYSFCIVFYRDILNFYSNDNVLEKKVLMMTLLVICLNAHIDVSFIQSIVFKFVPLPNHDFNPLKWFNVNFVFICKKKPDSMFCTKILYRTRKLFIFGTLLRFLLYLLVE